MRVALSIGDKAPIPLTPKVLPIPDSETLVELSMRAKDVVKAKLFLDAEDKEGAYTLQIGAWPDKRAVAEDALASEWCEFRCYDDSVKEWTDRCPLAQGCMGTSWLILYSNEESSVPMFVLAKVSIRLLPNDPREKMYDLMVKGLFASGLPHFVLDDFRGQMYKHKFSLEWDDGFTSLENENVMLLTLSRLVKHKLMPLVMAIMQAPVDVVESCYEYADLSRVRMADDVSRRNLHRLLSRDRSCDADELTPRRVPVPIKRVTYNSLPNIVLKTFLRIFILERLQIIRKEFEHRKLAHEREMVSYDKTHVKKGRMRINIFGEEKCIIERINHRLLLVESIEARVRWLLALPLFDGVRGELTVFDVESEVFMVTADYWRLYYEMLTFSRSRFWWVGDRQDGRWRVPQMLIDAKSGTSRLQTKYSLVYENWCFANLCRALVQLGFVCKAEDSNREEVEGCRYFVKGVTVVKLYHGIVAMQRKTGFRTKTVSVQEEFVCTDYGKEKLMPDFAIVVSQNNIAEWVVMDSKSDDRIKKHMVKKRNLYASSVEWAGRLPMASILLYSGEAFGSYPEIEVPPKGIGVRDPFAEEPFVDHSSDSYKWLNGKGFVKGAESPVEAQESPFHANFRANASSLLKYGSIFEDFVEGIVATAMRRISDRNLNRNLATGKS